MIVIIQVLLPLHTFLSALGKFFHCVAIPKNFKNHHNLLNWCNIINKYKKVGRDFS